MMRASKTVLLLVGVLVVLIGCGKPQESPEEVSAALVIHSNREDNNEIYVVNTDGSMTNLTNNPANDRMPWWSPDGSRIAFESNREGNRDIYVMNADGSNPVNLTNNQAYDFAFTWSPDASRIAFTSDRDGNFEIYVVNVDGSNQVNLTNNPSDDMSPTWSPDGSRIAFERMTSDGSRGYSIYVMNADGSNLIQLAGDVSTQNRSPTWSPDGSRIAFESGRDGSSEIYVANVDGSNPVNLTNDPALDAKPIWSPTGDRIMFERWSYDPEGHLDDANSGLFIMNADGSNWVRLDTSADDLGPAWSPDGSHIAFYSGSDSKKEIYVMDADGGIRDQLTTGLVAGQEMADFSYISWFPLQP